MARTHHPARNAIEKPSKGLLWVNRVVSPVARAQPLYPNERT